MTRSYKIVCIFLLCTVRYIFFGIKVISRLIGLIHENIAKLANKIFNVPNHLKLNLILIGKICFEYVIIKNRVI